MQSTDKRKAKRIMHPFNLRYKQISNEETVCPWDTSIARNISKNGIFFNASQRFLPGTEVELKINHPTINEKDHMHCLVIRSNPSATLEAVFETAVFIFNANEETKNSFNKTMDFFLQQ